MKQRGKVIAITNQKGGVEKTIATIHLGIELAKEGYQVLLVDLDPQGSLTFYLGGDLDNLEYSMGNTFDDLIAESKVNPQRGIIQHEEEVDILSARPSDIEIEEK